MSAKCMFYSVILTILTILCLLGYILDVPFLQIQKDPITEHQLQYVGYMNIQRMTTSKNDTTQFISLPVSEKEIVITKQSIEPSLEHEVALREVHRVSSELWLYVKSELGKLKQSTGNSTRKNEEINAIIREASDIQRKLDSDLSKLHNTIDEKTAWRMEESQKFADIVQGRILNLQNPKDCKNARKIVCDLNVNCGFGCQLHHVTFCLLVAYATQRTLILESTGWHYANGGWETIFKPLSKSCTTLSGEVAYGINETLNVFRLPVAHNIPNPPLHLFPALPEDLTGRIRRFHGQPDAWWFGQFVAYVTRPNERLKNQTEEIIKGIGFRNPIVGVQIRRTDKIGTEAEFHAVKEYMTHVEEWFDAYENRNPGITRKIYLASDDPGVLQETKLKYPAYTVLSNTDASTLDISLRFTEQSLRGIYIDIHLLSLCDFIVCTFSSNVCRAAYELMQTRHADASSWFKSLDLIYHFNGQNPKFYEAVQNHSAKTQDEMSFIKGHKISIKENHGDGYSKGKNIETGEEGLFPSYKVADVTYPYLTDKQI